MRFCISRAARSAPPPDVPLTISTARSGFQTDCPEAAGATINAAAAHTPAVMDALRHTLQRFLNIR
jgi:hypothetical protein